jgi:tetratricopeptide (TPR) repeat protein
MNEKLQAAIALRRQHEFEKAREILLSLVSQSEDPEVFYLCAITHDNLGLETHAIPFYEKAIELGLSGENLTGAYIGLGSSYRCVGEYSKAIQVLEKAQHLFPNNYAITVFLSMAKYNVGEHENAMRLLLQTIHDTSNSDQVQAYSKAIQFYSEHLDETWK